MMDQNVPAASYNPRSGYMVSSLPAFPADTPTFANESVGIVFVRVVVEKQRSFYLTTIRVTNIDSPEAVIEQVRVVRDDVLNWKGALKPLCEFFWGYRIALATLSTFRSIGGPGPHAPLEVNIRAREPCPEMNRASLLGDMEPFATLYPHVLEGGIARQALLVEKKLKRHNVLWCALVAIFVAVLTGVVIAVLSRNVAYGIGSSAGIVGTVAFLVQLSTWVTERGGV
ncbi:hypothetical protein F5Y19DRAFT_478555 [Xylariaceae sp. FL1651]|nr:hypothetical protein F5Y19DRAFT_478555 [Xylariaceae sp. FL1651]